MQAAHAPLAPASRQSRTAAPSIRMDSFRESYFDALFRIECSVFAEDSYRRELFRQMCEDNRELVVIARLGNRAIGYALAEPIPFGAEVVSIAVSARFRGRGVGRRLMQRLLLRLQRQGIPRVFLMVREDNQPAINLYRSLGFRRLRRVPEYYSDGETAIRMRFDFP